MRFLHLSLCTEGFFILTKWKIKKKLHALTRKTGQSLRTRVNVSSITKNVGFIETLAWARRPNGGIRHCTGCIILSQYDFASMAILFFIFRVRSRTTQSYTIHLSLRNYNRDKNIAQYRVRNLTSLSKLGYFLFLWTEQQKLAKSWSMFHLVFLWQSERTCCPVKSALTKRFLFPQWRIFWFNVIVKVFVND